MNSVQKHYSAHIPGDFYSIDIGICSSEKEARQDLRDILHIDKLPRNTEIWATSVEQHQKDIRIILDSNKSVGLYT